MLLKCSNAICDWPELSISIKSVVLYCIVQNGYKNDSSTNDRSNNKRRNKHVKTVPIGYNLQEYYISDPLKID